MFATKSATNANTIFMKLNVLNVKSAMRTAKELRTVLNNNCIILMLYSELPTNLKSMTPLQQMIFPNRKSTMNYMSFRYKKKHAETHHEIIRYFLVQMKNMDFVF